MGLCKCPKKKVTNQFCFEHRVNVCEHCIVADHTKCVVQSYLQWLNDSEYDPKCSLCKEPLDTQEECTRLVCYDVFHTSCLQKWGMSHPPHTAPAGYRCPDCKAGLFPAPQLASPVALALKHELHSWPWARKVMALPVNDDDDWKATNGSASGNMNPEIKPLLNNISTNSYKNGEETTNDPANVSKNNAPNYSSDDVFSNTPQHTSSVNNNTSAAVNNVPANNTSLYRDRSHSLRVTGDDPNSSNDSDTDKYKRRSAIVWFKRWWRSYQPLGSGNVRSMGKRRMFILLAIIFIATLILLLSKGRSSEDDGRHLEPAFDPLNNPNIHVQESI